MKTRFLTIAVALASLFAAPQAIAKRHTKTAAATKKHHHKKHMKTAAAPSTQAPTVQAAPAAS